MSIIINNIAYAPYVGDVEIGEAYLGDTLVYQKGGDYTFSFYGQTRSSVNFGLNIGFQSGSTFVNVPFTLDGTSRYSGTTTNGTQYYTNGSTQHDYDVSVKGKYGNQYTFYVNANFNVTNLTSVTMSSTMPAVNLADCFNCAMNLTSIAADGVSVTNMYNTFRNCWYLTDIDALASWETSNVTSMYGTFYLCRNLANIDALANWNTGNVTNTAYTFSNCFNLANIDALANWNTGNVTNTAYTFSNCFNLANIDALANWDTSNVTSMAYTFNSCNSLTNIDGLANWDTSNVTSMAFTFAYCHNLTNIDALVNWNTGNVTSMNYIFFSCQNLTNIDALANWNTGNVTSTANTFCFCYNLANIDALASWETSNVTNMSGTFYYCYNLTSITAINNWTGANANCAYFCRNTTNLGGNVAIQFNITCAANMFNGRSSAPMLNVYASTTTNAYNAIYEAMGNTTYNSSWQVTLKEFDPLYRFNIVATTANSTNVGVNFGFQNGSTFVNVPFTFNGDEIYSGTSSSEYYSNDATEHLFNAGVARNYGEQYTFYVNANTNVSEITTARFEGTMPAVNLANCFNGATNLTSIESDEMAVTNMASTFNSCYNLTNIDALANWNTSNVTNMAYTFNACQNFTNIDGLANLNTGNVTNMACTFWNCFNLTNIDGLANWTTSNVTNMYWTFRNCQNLTNVDGLINWNTSNVTIMINTFAYCYNLTSITGINNWTGATANCVNCFQSTINLSGNVAIQFNITNATNMFANRSSAPMLNVYASTTTNAYNAIYAAMGNTTYNSSWQVTLYELEQ